MNRVLSAAHSNKLKKALVSPLWLIVGLSLMGAECNTSGNNDDPPAEPVDPEMILFHAPEVVYTDTDSEVSVLIRWSKTGGRSASIPEFGDVIASTTYSSTEKVGNLHVNTSFVKTAEDRGTLTFKVNPQTKPGIYRYDLSVDYGDIPAFEEIEYRRGSFIRLVIIPEYDIRTTFSAPVRQIASGHSHNVALLEDGSVWAWGRNNRGQLGDRTTMDRSAPVRVPVLPGNIVQVVAGQEFSAALDDTGQIWLWGDHSHGQLGYCADTIPFQRYVVPQPIRLKIAVKRGGQFGDPSRTDCDEQLEQIAFEKIAAGNAHVLAMGNDQSVWSWGSNSHGQGRPPFSHEDGHKIWGKHPATRVTDIAAGGNVNFVHVALIPPVVYGRGDNRQHQLGTDNSDSFAFFVEQFDLPYPSRIFPGDEHVLALREGGTGYRSWGDNTWGQLGMGASEDIGPPGYPYLWGEAYNFTSLAGGGLHSLGMADGNVYGWGNGSLGQIGASADIPRQTTPVMIENISSSVMVDAGYRHSLSMSESCGTVKSWGASDYGQLGYVATQMFNSQPLPVYGIGETGDLSGCGVTLGVFIQGDGTVNSTPDAFGEQDCESACAAEFQLDTQITLVAIPIRDAEFVRWGGDCSGTDIIVTVTMESFRNCLAVFSPASEPPVELTVELTGNGEGNVFSNPVGIACETDCRHFFKKDSIVALRAQAAPFSRLVSWSGECSNGQVVMGSDRDCRVEFELISADALPILTVTKTGAGTGRVYSNPAGINCGVFCDARFNGEVNLTVEPAAGSRFVEWSDNCNDGTVNLIEDTECVAKFELISAGPTLTVSIIGNGDVSSNGGDINCGSTCSANFAEGTAVVLTASPGNAGFIFVAWEGDSACTDNADSNQTEVTMNTAVDCVARFAKEIRLYVQHNGAGSGTISSDLAGINCGSECDAEYPEGTVVTLTATSDSGSEFIWWTGDDQCADNADGNQTTVTLEEIASQDIVVCEAFFGLDVSGGSDYTLSYSIQGTGDGKVISSPGDIDCGNGGTVCSALISAGTGVFVGASGAAGSGLPQWSGGPNCTTGLITVNEDIYCIAKFDLLPPPVQYALSVVVGGTGSGTVSSHLPGISCPSDCSYDYNEGLEISLSATAASGSTFSGWGGDADCSDGVVAIILAVQCTAIFDSVSSGSFILGLTKVRSDSLGVGTVTSTPSGIDCNVDCDNDSASYSSGTPVQLTVTPANSDFQFDGWSGDCNASGQVTVNSDVNCTATFSNINYREYGMEIDSQGNGSVYLNGTLNCGPNGATGSCGDFGFTGSLWTLRAEPDSGATFTGWGGNCASYGTQVEISIVLSTDMYCSASFSGP